MQTLMHALAAGTTVMVVAYMTTPRPSTFEFYIAFMLTIIAYRIKP